MSVLLRSQPREGGRRVAAGAAAVGVALWIAHSNVRCHAVFKPLELIALTWEMHSK